MENFVECETVELANQVNMDVYRFVRYSEREGKYIFAKRIRK